MTKSFTKSSSRFDRLQKRTLRSVIGLLVVFITLSSFVSAKTLPPMAGICPKETILLIEADNFTQLKEQFKKTPMYGLYKDPAMAPFFGDIKKRIAESVKEMDSNNIIRNIYDADIVPAGRVGLSVLMTSLEDPNKPPQPMIAVEWGDQLSAAKKWLADLLEKNAEMGGHQKTAEEFRGNTIEVMVDEADGKFYYCFYEDAFFASPDIEPIKFALAHMKTDLNTLADDAAYSSTMASLRGENDIKIFFNIREMIKMVMFSSKQQDMRTMISTLGLDNVVGFGMVTGIGRAPNHGSTAKGLLRVNGPKRGILKIIEPQTKSYRVPSFVPADAYEFSVIHLDPKDMYQEIYNLAYSINPGFAMMIPSNITQPGPTGEPGLQVKKDILDHLGSEIISTSVVNKPFESNPVPKSSLFAISVLNRSALENTLSTLYSMYILPNNPDGMRELLGHNIYTLPLTGLLTPAPMQTMLDQDPQNMQMLRLALTVTDSHVILGLETAVENAIRKMQQSGQDSIQSKQWFSKTRAAVPSSVGIVGLQKAQPFMEMIWWVLKNQGAKGLMQTPAPAPMPIDPDDMPFDFSLLPDFETVKKYFTGATGSYLVSKPEGFYFESKDVPVE